MLTNISIPHSPAPTITYSCAFPATCASPFLTTPFSRLSTSTCALCNRTGPSHTDNYAAGGMDTRTKRVLGLFCSSNGLETMFNKGRRVARWKKGTTVDIVVTISRMKWVRYWDDEMIIAGDAVDDYIWWVIIFIFIFGFQLFLPSSYRCYWTHPLLRSISTAPCQFFVISFHIFAP
jgi:hypothetical protein